MNWDIKKCKICEAETINSSSLKNKVDIYQIECPKCGIYRISDSFLASETNIPGEDFELFSGYLRVNSSLESPITITSDYFEKIPNIVLPLKRMSVSEKVNNVLRYIYESTSKVLGRVDLNFNPKNSP